MRNAATLAIQGEKLPPELSAALEGGEAGALYAVRVEKMSAEDAAEYLEMRAKVQEGIAAADAGDVIDAEELYQELERDYGISITR